MPFAIDPRLLADTHPITQLGLSDLLLMNDARFPWCILVPRVADARELHGLLPDQAGVLLAEITQVSAALQRISAATKMNVAALGNQVPQLHLHIVARHTSDAAWPRPVWGVGNAEPYAAPALAQLRNALLAAITPR